MSLFSFGENNIAVPTIILDEIDRHKHRQDTAGLNARITFLGSCCCYLIVTKFIFSTYRSLIICQPKGSTFFNEQSNKHCNFGDQLG